MRLNICTRYTSLVLKAVLLLLIITCSTFSQQEKEAIPGLLDISKLKIEIHEVMFVKELIGANGTFKETDLEKSRGIVVTLRITKPANSILTLYAQDLSLHYSRTGEDFDVAKCSGLSSFSASTDVDRPMNLYRVGLGRITTGTATQKASVVYLDTFFQNMEPDTRDLYLLVAQPAGVSFRTKGWSK